MIAPALWIGVLGLLCLGGLGGEWRAGTTAPPRVVRTSPETGAEGVDPGTDEIRVVFDQPMSRGGHSIVGGGPSFPALAGKPRWINDRTMVIPVSLEPDHEYRFGLNSQTFRNFRGANGEPAEPYPVRFWTAPADDAVPLTLEQNQTAYDTLVGAVTTRYAHRDRLRLDWVARLERFRDELLGAETPTEFGRHTARLLAAAKDKHVAVRVGDTALAGYSHPVTPNVNPALLAGLVPEWAEPSRRVRTGRFEDGVGYLAINSWSANNKDDLEAVFEAIEQFKEAPGLILDVRLNGGGDELLARSVAGCFIEGPRLYATHVSVTDGAGSPSRVSGGSGPRRGGRRSWARSRC